MLSDAEISELRTKVSTAHQRRTFKHPPIRTTYHGGPLDGLTSIDEFNTAPICGWCVVQRDGPTVCRYVRDDAGVMRFQRYERPGGNAVHHGAVESV
jgi:hypothetical protein